jgi:hypothetical protein
MGFWRDVWNYRPWRRRPAPPLPVVTTNGTFTLSLNGDSTWTLPYDAAGAAIAFALNVIGWQDRWAENAGLSGADHEEEFYSDYNDGTRPYDPKWYMTEGRWDYFSYPYPDGYYAVQTKNGLFIDEIHRTEDDVISKLIRTQERMWEALESIWGSNIWDWDITIGDDEDHIIRSEN